MDREKRINDLEAEFTNKARELRELAQKHSEVLSEMHRLQGAYRELKEQNTTKKENEPA